jgi:serine protease Do
MSERKPDVLAVGSRRALASVAAIALIASGALGAIFIEARARALAVDAPATTAAPAATAGQDKLPVSFADVVDKVKPAVVAVQAKLETASLDEDGVTSHNLDQVQPQLPQGDLQALGSGFFISADGYIVTNNHVVDHAASVQVSTGDGGTLDAKVVGTDPKSDIALLKVTEGGPFPFVRLAKTTPRVGDWVVAIGNPFGLGGTVTAGIVSARGRDIGESQFDDFLQIDAPINRGNSGGPTFDLDGEVVGVNTAIFSPSGGSVGLAFAIPSETVESVIAQLEKDGKVTRGFLGVQIQPLSKDLANALGLSSRNGALVDNVQDGTPAAKAGLKAGDVITAINGEAVATSRELTRKIAAFKPGTNVELTYRRGGKVETASAQLGTLPNKNTAPAESRKDRSQQLGLRLAPAQEVPGAGDQGVAIVGVDPSSLAADKGLEDGDVILEVDGQAVSTPGEVEAGVDAARKEGRKAALLRIKNREGTRFVAIAMPNAG